MPSGAVLSPEVQDILAKCEKFARDNPITRYEQAERRTLKGKLAQHLRWLYSTCNGTASTLDPKFWDTQADRIIHIVAGSIRASATVDPATGMRRAVHPLDDRLAQAIDDFLMGAEAPPPDPLPDDEPQACEPAALSGEGLGVAHVA